MATFFHNITTVLTKDLLTPVDKINSVSSITIANLHASASAEVDLFLNKGSDNFYILKNVEVPHGMTLLLESQDIPSFNGYSIILYRHTTITRISCKTFYHPISCRV